MGINPVGLQCVASQGSGEGTSQDFPLLPLGSPGERRARASSWLARGSRGAQTVSPSAALIRLFFFYRPNAPVFNPQLGAGFMVLGMLLPLPLLPSCVGGEGRHNVFKILAET